MEVNQKDIQFLREEYEISQKEMILNEIKENLDMANFYRGQKRGLEMALVRLGVTNDELDELCYNVHTRLKREGIL